MVHKKNDRYDDLAALFFETRQIIRDNLRGQKPDPNAWLRYETLRYIARSTPTMQEIAGHLRVRASSATSLIAHLTRDGWVMRGKSGTDKRIVRIIATSKGSRVLSVHRLNSAATMRRVFSKLPANDVKMFLQILERVRDAHQR